MCRELTSKPHLTVASVNMASLKGSRVKKAVTIETRKMANMVWIVRFHPT
jgi:hypothetical protein